MGSLKLEWKKMGWINFAETVSSFPLPGLPADVHFSVSYSPNTEMANLHLTRNVKGIPEANNPQVRIAEWPKAEMEEMARIFFYRYWQNMWIPFDMRKYQYRSSREGRHARYCSITRMIKPGKTRRIHRQLKAHVLQPMQRKRQGRLLVWKEDWIKDLKKQVVRPAFLWEMMDSFGRVPRHFAGPSEIGYLYAGDFSGMVIRIQGEWFTPNPDANFISVFQAVFEPGIFLELQEKVTEAIALLSTATTRKDTDPFYDPVRLVIVQKEESVADGNDALG